MVPFALKFDRGKKFQADMKAKFGHPVVFSPGFRQKEFTMVVSFTRASFRINVHTVSVSLLAMFGGYAQGFRVRFLKDRSYKFSVASRAVGFETIMRVKLLRRILSWFLTFGTSVARIGNGKKLYTMLSLIKNGP